MKNPITLRLVLVWAISIGFLATAHHNARASTMLTLQPMSIYFVTNSATNAVLEGTLSTNSVGTGASGQWSSSSGTA